ncbi:hypothetical protein ACEN4K_07085, partial [Marinilactibacillus psychrotolerans]|uniref:hypothetical protein n=1 Tax=Marinilactibacillus psychrotolerans TaxID=191770 RepID=UPI00388827CB
ILRLFTEGERLAEPISLSKQRKTIKGKSDSRDFLQQLDTHFFFTVLGFLNYFQTCIYIGSTFAFYVNLM